MAGLRIIPRLDIKGPNLIKGIRLEGLRVVGDPHAFALRYYAQGADEMVFMDIVASLYQRNSLSDIIRRAANQIYIPITVGGGRLPPVALRFAVGQVRRGLSLLGGRSR